jgi:hypothetical protein
MNNNQVAEQFVQTMEKFIGLSVRAFRYVYAKWRK